MKHWGKKLAALILCAAMMIGLLPGMARADGKTITGLGTGAISNPVEGAGGWSKVQSPKEDP